ncbi:MAG TPA: NADH-quinone oxidoreductase subunit A, partial [Kribbella sp.]|nr:NADH-quinone oxidoreductase subunit A [Kribbella sp.]
WAQVHIRYYLFAYLYVIFAVDAIYLFPWATIFNTLGFATLIEMFVFLAFVAVGLLYAYRKGVLRWT